MPAHLEGRSALARHESEELRHRSSLVFVTLLKLVEMEPTAEAWHVAELQGVERYTCYQHATASHHYEASVGLPGEIGQRDVYAT